MKTLKSTWCIAALTLTAVLWLSARAGAQSGTTGAIAGQVRDVTGLVLPGDTTGKISEPYSRQAESFKNIRYFRSPLQAALPAGAWGGSSDRLNGGSGSEACPRRYPL